MSINVFSGVVLVEIQGHEALIYLGDQINAVKYMVVGFNKHPVFINDYRSSIGSSISNLLNTGDATEFLEQLNSFAFAKVERLDNGELHISLEDTFETVSETILWIVVGLGNRLPCYDYRFLEIEPIDNEQFVIIAVYDYPEENSSQSLLLDHSMHDQNRSLGPLPAPQGHNQY